MPHLKQGVNVKRAPNAHETPYRARIASRARPEIRNRVRQGFPLKSYIDKPILYPNKSFLYSKGVPTVSTSIPSLGEAFRSFDGLYVDGAYREIPRYRFVPDAKPHHHLDLTKQIQPGARPFELRHWIIQDVYNSAHVDETLRQAKAYGMTGIQFSGDNIYWVNDSLHRYNAGVFTGMLCEKCHDLNLDAYFWTHEINGFFQEFVIGGRYGFYGQLAEGKIDLSSRSGYWDTLYEKFDVFFRRQPGVDGLVLTLNESQVPVFRDECITSDLSPEERVARIGQTVQAACKAHDKRLILRTFCYHPDEAARIRDGVRRIGSDLTVMIKCVSHDWQTFFPHDPLIVALSDFPRVIEFDLAHEHAGGSRFPYPDTDHLVDRFSHSATQGAQGVAGRIDRFRNHAEGTLNWSNVYSFSRLAQDPSATADALREEYAATDFGEANGPFIAQMLRRLYAIGEKTFFISKEWGTQHSNLLPLSPVKYTNASNRALWAPDDAEAVETNRLLADPSPDFIERVALDKRATLEDLRQLASEVEIGRAGLDAADYDYLSEMFSRAIVQCEALTIQHVVILMLRYDAGRTEDERRYGTEISTRLERLRELARTEARRLIDASNEGCQHSPQIIERFCRSAERALST